MPSRRELLKLSAAFVGVGATSQFTISALAQEKIIQIGLPNELSGRFAEYGITGNSAAKMALEAFGSKAGPFKIEPLFRDVRSDTPSTVSVMTELLTSQNVKFMVGPLVSGIVSASIPVWQANKNLWICPAGTTTKIEEEVGKEDLFFHTFAYAYNYYDTATKALKALAGDKAKKVAMLYVDDSYGRTHLPYAEQYFSDSGFEIVAKEIVRSGTVDMGPVLTKIALTSPDVLIGLMQTSDAVTMAKQVYTRKMNIPYILGTAYTELDQWQSAVGEAQEGWMGISAYINGMDRPASVQYPKIFPRLADWAKSFREKYNIEPTSVAVSTYVSVAMLLIAIEKAQSSDMQTVAAELSKLDIDTIGGRGRFSATPSGTRNQAFSEMILFQRRGGKDVIVYPSDVATGPLLPNARR